MSLDHDRTIIVADIEDVRNDLATIIGAVRRDLHPSPAVEIMLSTCDSILADAGEWVHTGNLTKKGGET